MSPVSETSPNPLDESCFFLAKSDTDPGGRSDGRGIIDELASVAAVAPFAKVAEAPAETERFTYYDTFDWRLHDAGILLTVAAGKRPLWTWRSLDGMRRHQIRAATTPATAKELPPGPFEQLAPRLSMRRLLPVVEIERRSLPLRVLDDEEKTVARLWIEHGQVVRDDGEKEALPPRVRLRAVRGYDTAYHHLMGVLHKSLGLAPCGNDELTLATSVIVRHPGDYSSKPALELDPAQSAEEAIRGILLALLAAIERNEEGTRQDLDSEFLHDFRVAVRRTRSALGQIKGVFGADEITHFRDELKWLGGITGPTRDLDVYLLKFGEYESALPESVRGDLAPLRQFLVAEQRREQRRLSRALAGERNRALLGAWRMFLEQEGRGDRPGAPNAHRPASEVASERIWKVYRRILKRGRKAVEHDSPAPELHGLRIECKKLRYLLELFRSLYPTAVDESVKTLKRLQDNLGDFNDYEVQGEKLMDFARTLHSKGETPVETFLAMGRLQARLEEGQERERQRFAKRFRGFASAKHRKHFEDLFANG